MRTLIAKRNMRIAWYGPCELWELVGGLYALSCGTYLAYYHTLVRFTVFLKLIHAFPEWFWCLGMGLFGAAAIMSMVFQFCIGRVVSCTGMAIIFVWVAQLIGETRDGAWQPFTFRLIALLMFTLAIRVTIRQYGGRPRRVLD